MEIDATAVMPSTPSSNNLLSTTHQTEPEHLTDNAPTNKNFDAADLRGNSGLASTRVKAAIFAAATLVSALVPGVADAKTRRPVKHATKATTKASTVKPRVTTTAPTTTIDANAAPNLSELSPDWQSAVASTWNVVKGKSKAIANLRSIPDVAAMSKRDLVLVVPKGTSSEATREIANDGRPDGGPQVLLTPVDGLKRDAATLRFDVFLPADFNFVKGGKLFGVYLGDGASGGNQSDGVSGGSMRVMWRENGKLELYGYLPNGPEQAKNTEPGCDRIDSGKGVSFGRGNISLARGVWNTIDVDLVLNAPGLANGTAKLRVNGVERIACSGLTYRFTDALKIEGIYASVFFGGTGTEWDSTKEEIVVVRDAKFVK